MPKLNRTLLAMRAQALNPDNSKILLVYLYSYCSADDKFWLGVNSGLKALETTREIPTEGK
jgi:hypothetical protein